MKVEYTYNHSNLMKRGITLKAAMIGDNCIDHYNTYIDNEGNVKTDIKYPTGNVVDTGVNLKKFGIDVSIISTTGSDENGQWMKDVLVSEGLDVSHLKTGNGPTAITYMSLNGNDRVHGDYIEGVLETIVFDKEDIAFAASHDLVHSALWGKAEDALSEIKKISNTLISFDYADRLDSPIIEKTLGSVDFGFFSYHKKRDTFIEEYLMDKVAHGMKIATATFGEEGSLAYDGKSFITSSIVPVETVVNTIGAGDSYIAGFLAGILQGKEIQECMCMGATIASKVVQIFNPWES